LDAYIIEQQGIITLKLKQLACPEYKATSLTLAS